MHDYLMSHPDCDFATIKELHYFDMKTEADVGQYSVRARKEIVRLQAPQNGTSGFSFLRRARRMYALERWFSVLEQNPLSRNLRPYLQYLTATSGPGRLVGDVTPSYALLPATTIRRMAQIAKDVCFVTLLWDPVSRLWSHVRMLATRQRGENEVETAALGLFDRAIATPDDADVKGITALGDYASCVQRLTDAVPKERPFIGVMESVLSAPGVSELCKFLGIEDRSASVERRVHEGTPIALNARRFGLARAALSAQYELVKQTVSQLPSAWARPTVGYAT